jgi:hypothetical protein
MRTLLVAITALLAGCLDLTTTTGNDAGAGGAGSGGSGSSSGATSSGDAGAASSGSKGATSGTNCTTDATSGITLCEQIDACPGLVVDQGAFPGCGFRMNAASMYDLECGCGDSLCPIGAPTSCSDASQLLDQAQSSVLVCEELNAGSCLPLSGAAGSTQGGTGASQSTCDKSCESECAGDPNCIQMCGC